MTFLSGGRDARNSSARCFPNLPTFSLIATFNTSQICSEELAEDLLAALFTLRGSC